MGYSLLRRRVEGNGLFALCHELDVTLIAYQPIVGGLLTGKYTPAHRPPGIRRLLFSRRYATRNQPLIALMRQLGEAHGGKSPDQVALNWLICKGALPIPGAKNGRQMQENADALGWRLYADTSATLHHATEGL